MKRFLLLAAILLPMVVMAQNKKVALLETLNGDKDVQIKGIEKNMVRGELRKAISNQTGYQAFTRTDIDQLMKEHGFQKSGMVSDDQRQRLGEMTGADYICVSTLTKSYKQFYLEAYLIEVETGEISNPASQFGVLQGNTYTNLFQLCVNLAKELINEVSGSSVSITQSPTGGNVQQGKKPIGEVSDNKGGDYITEKESFILPLGASVINYVMFFDNFTIGRIKADRFAAMRLKMEFEEFKKIITGLIIDNANDATKKDGIIISNERPSNYQLTIIPLSADNDGENTIKCELVEKQSKAIISSFQVNTNGGDEDKFEEEFMEKVGKNGKKIGKTLAKVMAKSKKDKPKKSGFRGMLGI